MSGLARDDALAGLGVEQQMRLLHEVLYPAGTFPAGTVLPMSHGDKKDWSFRPAWDDLDPQVAYALSHLGTAVYRSAVAMPADLPPGARGAAKDVVAACALWADIDDSRGVHHMQALPDPSPEQAWELLDGYPLEPTGVIDTGGGLLAFWAVGTFDPRSAGGRRLLNEHTMALERLHEAIGVSFDPAVPKSVAPAPRVPAGVNGKQIPKLGPGWTKERLELMDKGIARAPVRLVWLQPANRYHWLEVGQALEESGLLEQRHRSQASGQRHHVCGGPSPEERICLELPMARVCREMAFVGPDGGLIEWADRESIEDDADGWPLTWSHEDGRTTYARLFYEPPVGHEEMEPVSTLTCWGTGTAEVFATRANSGKVCTWKWLRWAYFKDARQASNFARRFCGHPDEAIALLKAHPRSEDLLAEAPSLSGRTVIVDGGRELESKEGVTARVKPRKFDAMPWAKRHSLEVDPTEIKKWFEANPSKRYGLALEGKALFVGTANGASKRVPLVRSAVESLVASLKESGGKLYAHAAPEIARSVAVSTKCTLLAFSTRAALAAINPGQRCEIPVSGEEEAIVVAALADALSEQGPLPAQAAAMDHLWVRLSTEGIRVDRELLRRIAENDDNDSSKAAELLAASRLDGRVRPIVVAYGARTGRMRVQDPALQNLGPKVRPALMADEGKALVGLDLHQVEPKVAALLSGDAAMKAAVQKDCYLGAASVIWPGKEPTTDMRQSAKVVLLAQLYGEGHQALASRLGIGADEARRLVETLLAGWPYLRQWREELIAKARSGARLATFAGRPLPLLTAKEAWRGVNYVVQGSAADIFYEMVKKVAKALGEGSRLWLAVHDELVVECPSEQVDAVKDILATEMSLVVDGVTITGDAVVYGDRWL